MTDQENSTSSPAVELITPYGGKLINRVLEGESAAELTERAQHLPSIRLSNRSVCDLELLATGAFSPLDRFMGKADFYSVLNDMRLTNGMVFPLPITLPVDTRDEHKLTLDKQIALRDAKNDLLAVMRVEEIYPWNLAEVGQKVIGSTDLRHPLIAEMHRWGPVNISGQLDVLQLPRHYDFKSLRMTPAQTRSALQKLGHRNVVAFQTRNPLHRAHEELTKLAIEDIDGAFLLHPVVGVTKPGDVDHFTRVRTYRVLAERYYDPARILLALVPLAMRMAGPREAVWHALIRRNYGANHLIVGRDHAGAGKDSQGKDFHGPYEAQELVTKYQEELGVKVVDFKLMVYLPDEERYTEIDKVPKGTKFESISGTQVRDDYLAKGRLLPEWFTRPEVARILQESYPPIFQQGACIWLTGLPGAGKSTTANVVAGMLPEYGRRVSILDGDEFRTEMNKELGFTKEDRDANVRRMGRVAAEIVRHGGIVLCASVSPYRSTRNEVRALVGAENYLEVYVDTPIEVCEKRDPKGLYAQARRGELKGFTGIDDPYEPPQHPELQLETLESSAEDNARRIIDLLIARGFIVDEATSDHEAVGA
jgi:sulfate adenylyltransferase